jgi:hypothetical protein
MAAIELDVDEQIRNLDSVIPLLAKFTQDVPSKNITAGWPELKELWTSLKDNRPKWTDLEFLTGRVRQLLGVVVRIRGYALALPPNPPG